MHREALMFRSSVASTSKRVYRVRHLRTFKPAGDNAMRSECDSRFSMIVQHAVAQEKALCQGDNRGLAGHQGESQWATRIWKDMFPEGNQH